MSRAYGVDRVGLPSPVGTHVMDQREGILPSLSIINTAEGVHSEHMVWPGGVTTTSRNSGPEQFCRGRVCI